jgi:CRISPR/Cas system-associated exonuclease Cas4 (RecB family)
MIQQHILNVPEARLTQSVKDEDLKSWWSNYLQNPPGDLPAIRFPEIILSAPISDFRLVAKYDLLAIEPGERAVIVDWKTSQRRPSHRWMADRIQTKVYRYLLVRAGTHLNNGDQLLPSLVEMIYWFANNPEEPERLLYNEAKFNADNAFLTAIIEEIQGLGEDEFVLTDQEFKCLYCRYRSLCLRGVGAGEIDKMTSELEPREDIGSYLDFDQISEVEF